MTNNSQTPKDLLDAYFDQIVFEGTSLESLKEQIRTRLKWAYEAGVEDGVTKGLTEAQQAIDLHIENHLG